MTKQLARASVGAPALQRNVADLRALAHPLRLRMMELFAESPKTTKQVADLLQQPPTRLYHHVAALERAGLLILKETRKNRGTVEKWYAGVSQQLRGTASGKTAAERRSARRAVAATVLEQAKQELVSMPPGAKEAALLARLVLVVPSAKIPAIRKRLFDTVQSLQKRLRKAGVDEKDCERWAVTVAFAPVTPARARGR